MSPYDVLNTLNVTKCSKSFLMVNTFITGIYVHYIEKKEEPLA